MPRNKEPINILEAKNKSHLTNQQKENRKQQESRMKPPTDEIKPPKWLSKEAKKEFKVMSVNLKRLQESAKCSFISNLDVPLLAMWADAYVEYQVCCNEIESCSRIEGHGGLLTTSEKGVDLNPLLNQKKKLFEQMEKIGRQFGLSPASRLTITLPPSTEEKPESKWAKFMGEDRA
jgi:P27 family predicted phage terminase small subunit